MSNSFERFSIAMVYFAIHPASEEETGAASKAVLVVSSTYSVPRYVPNSSSSYVDLGTVPLCCNKSSSYK